ALLAPVALRQATARRPIAIALIALLLGSAAAAGAWDLATSKITTAQRSGDNSGRVRALAGLEGSGLPDLRIDLALLRAAVLDPPAEPVPGPVAVALRVALGHTGRAAEQDRHLAVLRGRIDVRLGDRQQGLAVADAVRRDVGPDVPPYADDIAQLYAEAGRPDKAATLEAPLIRQQGGPGDGWPRAALLGRLLGPDNLVARCAAGYAAQVTPAPAGASLPLPLSGTSCDLLRGGVR
ncbi:MAG: hypothetical protein M3O32_04025, partial [Actinomycetota bacterium]|nr:hypothetical protein [Actinomycetota bacterium]